ncbi:uncharacterized protein BX664DRAFT_318143 [Halteromyces radiatus]|uniref:uncharacterized protein n=1 Tax=Halteromyces radiatus TaxID=101107 RepID=UPI0022210E7E|nr:uncharacterized protein BX664DRAFT_318143 [Halteromyces radiatus]KAI8078803.1 hypothetical protein BX664DRAFT_318143 [Halteromyces radiatus]
MYLNTFLLVLLTILSYECVFIEALYDLDCLAKTGKGFIDQIRNCREESCVEEVRQVFTAERCLIPEYKMCYQTASNSLLGGGCTTQESDVFSTLQDCESSPNPNFNYIKRQCTPVNDDCHKVICGTSSS